MSEQECGYKTNGLSDPRESYPEESPNAYAMHEPPSRIELIADLLKETHRIEKHTAILEDALTRTHRLLADKVRRYDALAERVVKAERAIVDCDTRGHILAAVQYMETLDTLYVTQLRLDNEEARSA